MTDDDKKSRLDLLRRMLTQVVPEDPQKYETTLAELQSCQDAGLIKEYLGLLDDTMLYDQRAFALVHAAERFDDDVYMEALLDAFPEFSQKNPAWSSILLIRALNDYKCRTIAIRLARESAQNVKESISVVLEEIKKEAPELLGVMVGLMVVVDS